MSPILTASSWPDLPVRAIYSHKWSVPTIASAPILQLYQIGRGMRLSPNTGKDDCRIIDFVESTERSGGTVTVPSLFGLNPEEVDIEGTIVSSLPFPPEWIPSDDNIKSLEEKARNALRRDATPRLEIASPKFVTYTDYEDPFSWVEENSGAPHVNRISQFAWVGCGNDTYVLECLGQGFVRIDSTDVDGGSSFGPLYLNPLNIL